MKIIDVSMTIHRDMPVYKNKDEKRPVITVTSDFKKGSSYESRIDMDLHTGTHIDMPLHMIEGGKTSESLDIHRLVAKCFVIDLTGVEGKITEYDLRSKVLPSCDFILFKTKNSFCTNFDPDFVYLDVTGAEYISSIGIKGVGTDALGIERAQPGHETHKILLGSGIIIIEGLRLAHVEEGIYQMIALPLKIDKTEALPARVILAPDVDFE
ncbi:MAG TPA: cyclase family protein [Pseudobacteroides sp.]|uniref:cyclase family protein n=1 Tax=Pseudobacteroides sp. TaxID=1968840 RepID=UPI002F93A757